jgi:hypothetical protein
LRIRITVSISCALLAMTTAVSGQRPRTCSASQMPSCTGIITSHNRMSAGSAAIMSMASSAFAACFAS